MTCTDRQDQLLLLAADALDAAERDEVRAHLATGCPVCAGHLAEAQAVLAELPKALPQLTPPPEARQRLLDRVTAEGADRDRPATIKLPGAPTVTRTRVAWWPAALAASVAVVVGLAGWSSVRHLQDKNNDLRAQVTAKTDQLATADTRATELGQQLAAKDDELVKQDQTISRLRDQVRNATDTVDFLRSPNLLLVEIGPTHDAPDKAKMTILRDKANTKWLVVADGLQPLPPDRAYELWFITPDDKKIPAGTFTVDPKGAGSMLVSVPRDIRIAVTAVTDEPAGGSKSPTGKIRLAGSPDRPTT